MANGVCDMMSHIMERYFTNTTHTDVTDGSGESVLRTIMSNARIQNGITLTTTLGERSPWRAQ